MNSEPLSCLALLFGACELIRFFLDIENNCADTIGRHSNSQTSGSPRVWDLCNPCPNYLFHCIVLSFVWLVWRKSWKTSMRVVINRLRYELDTCEAQVQCHHRSRQQASPGLSGCYVYVVLGSQTLVFLNLNQISEFGKPGCKQGWVL